jgi:hypothetical protein
MWNQVCSKEYLHPLAIETSFFVALHYFTCPSLLVPPHRRRRSCDRRHSRCWSSSRTSSVASTWTAYTTQTLFFAMRCLSLNLLVGPYLHRPVSKLLCPFLSILTTAHDRTSRELPLASSRCHTSPSIHECAPKVTSIPSLFYF